MKLDELSYSIAPKKFEYLTITLSMVSSSAIEPIENIVDKYLLSKFGAVIKKRQLYGDTISDSLEGVISYNGRYSRKEHGSILLKYKGVTGKVTIKITSSEKKALNVIKTIRDELNPILSDEVIDAYERLRILTKHDLGKQRKDDLLHKIDEDNCGNDSA